MACSLLALVPTAVLLSCLWPAPLLRKLQPFGFSDEADSFTCGNILHPKTVLTYAACSAAASALALCLAIIPPTAALDQTFETDNLSTAPHDTPPSLVQAGTAPSSLRGTGWSLDLVSVLAGAAHEEQIGGRGKLYYKSSQMSTVSLKVHEHTAMPFSKAAALISTSARDSLQLLFPEAQLADCVAVRGCIRCVFLLDANQNHTMPAVVHVDVPFLDLEDERTTRAALRAALKGQLAAVSHPDAAPWAIQPLALRLCADTDSSPLQRLVVHLATGATRPRTVRAVVSRFGRVLLDQLLDPEPGANSSTLDLEPGAHSYTPDPEPGVHSYTLDLVPTMQEPGILMVTMLPCVGDHGMEGEGGEAEGGAPLAICAVPVLPAEAVEELQTLERRLAEEQLGQPQGADPKGSGVQVLQVSHAAQLSRDLARAMVVRPTAEDTSALLYSLSRDRLWECAALLLRHTAAGGVNVIGADFDVLSTSARQLRDMADAMVSRASVAEESSCSQGTSTSAEKEGGKASATADSGLAGDGGAGVERQPMLAKRGAVVEGEVAAEEVITALTPLLGFKHRGLEWGYITYANARAAAGEATPRLHELLSVAVAIFACSLLFVSWQGTFKSREYIFLASLIATTFFCAPARMYYPEFHATWRHAFTCALHFIVAFDFIVMGGCSCTAAYCEPGAASIFCRTFPGSILLMCLLPTIWFPTFRYTVLAVVGLSLPAFFGVGGLLTWPATLLYACKSLYLVYKDEMRQRRLFLAAQRLQQ